MEDMILNERFEKLKKDLLLLGNVWNTTKNGGKPDFKFLRPRLLKLISYCTTVKEIDYLIRDEAMSIPVLNKMKQKNPENSKEIDEHIKWLKTTYLKALRIKKKELKKKLNESISINLNNLSLIENTIFLSEDLNLDSKLETVRAALIELEDIVISLTSYDKKIKTKIDKETLTGILVIKDYVSLSEDCGFKSKFKNSIESQLGLLKVQVNASIGLEDDEMLSSVVIKVSPNSTFSLNINWNGENL